jgi:hypothetical protein
MQSIKVLGFCLHDELMGISSELSNMQLKQLQAAAHLQKFTILNNNIPPNSTIGAPKTYTH